MMTSKIGLFENDDEDLKLIQDLEDMLHASETDMTLFFRNLSDLKKGDKIENLEVIKDAFYQPEEIKNDIKSQWLDWFEGYTIRLQKEKLSDKERQAKMNLVNPKYVLRNYMAQLAIDDANNGDYKLIDKLFQLLKKPYSEQPENEKWFAKRPEWARDKVGCSMLSCSS